MKKRGFTLIEVLIAVAIITILSLAALFLVKRQLARARDGRRKADIHKIQQAVEEYEKDHDCYPPPDLVDCDPGTGLTPYLNLIPCDPLTKDSYVYEPSAVGGCPYWYRIFTVLENSGDKDLIPGIGPDGDTNYNFYQSSPNAPVPEPSLPTPTPGATSTPGPTASPSCGAHSYFGCFPDGLCHPVGINPENGCPVCQPGYDSMIICRLNCPGILCVP